MALRRRPLITSLVLLPILLVSFQNCSGIKTDSPPARKQSSAQTGNNAIPYYGKVYVKLAANVCADGSAVETKVVYQSPSSAELIREGCADLSPSILLTASSFQIDPNNIDQMIYNQQTLLTAEAPQANNISHVQSAVAADQVASSISVSLNSALSAGNLVVCVVTYSGVKMAVSLSDSVGNTFVRAATAEVPTSDVYREVWYRENAIASPAGDRIRANFDGTYVGSNISCVEFGGVASSQALDQVAVAYGPASSVGSTDTGASVATTTPNQLILSVIAGDGIIVNPDFQVVPNLSVDPMIVTKNVTSVGTFAPTFFQQSFLNRVWSSVTLSFKSR